MLYLLFRLGQDRYALGASCVEEVLPVVDWKQIPQSAPGILGVFNFRGAMVPLLDLSEYIIGQPSRLYMSTRIILVKYRESDAAFDSEEYVLGLLAEGATDTFQCSPEEFTEPGIEVASAPYLGPVTADEHGIIQLIEIGRLLPPGVKDQLFRQKVEIEQEAFSP